jgi:hypothetical protein
MDCSCEFKPECACNNKTIVPEYCLTVEQCKELNIPITAEIMEMIHRQAERMDRAEKYAKMLARQRAYYHRNAEKISAKWKEQHHQAHPDAGVRPNRRRKGSSSDEGSS